MSSRSSSIVSPSTSTVSSPMSLDLLDGPSRRLFKARHQDVEKMEIQTNVLTAVLYYDIKFTIYKLQIRSTVRAPDTVEWMIAKRYSEFFSFRQTLHKLFEKWDLQFHGDDAKRMQCEEFALATKLLLPALEFPTFPRKHMRCDNKKIVNERRPKLQRFVRSMLDAYTDISVFLHDTQSGDSHHFTKLNQMMQQIEEFLGIPQEQKEVNRRQTAAILALEDVDDVPSAKLGCKDRTCCICLNDYDSDDDEPELDETHDENRMVKLPCSHQFHEDCVLGWFNASTTCPLCRKPAFTEADSIQSFDVSIN